MSRPAALADTDADPFSEREIALMLAAAGVDGQLAAARPVETGANAVYEVDLSDDDGRTEAVFKAATSTSPESFRHEPAILECVDERTAVPVPSVLGSHCSPSDLPAPSYVMDRVEGRSPDASTAAPGADAGALDHDRRVTVAEEVGEHLARLHDLASFDAPGTVIVDGGALAVDGGADSWSARLFDLLDGVASELDRVDVDRTAVRTFVSDEIRALSDVDLVPIHSDCQPRNTVVDAAAGEVRAILDWGNVRSAPAAYELVLTEQYFSRWAPPESDRRLAIREALLDGYRRRRSIEVDARRRRLYLVVTALRILGWADYWPAPVADRFLDEQGRLLAGWLQRD